MIVRLKDIALEAGVDIGTVSHVLNNRPKAYLLRPETRERINRVAGNLGYCRNELAASMPRRRGKVLAFVCGDMGCIEYTGRVQNGIFDAASDLDYSVSIHHLDSCGEEMIINKVMGWRNAGVIFHLGDRNMTPKLLATLRKHNIPHGFVNLSNPDGIGVTTDDRHGIVEAVRHLRERGCRKPVFFGYSADLKASSSEYIVRRTEGFRAGLAKYYPGQEAVFLYDDNSVKLHEQRKCLRRVLSEIKDGNFDGVACISDTLAIRLQQMASTVGMKVPDDFLLTGFGDTGLGLLTVPTLTTVSQDFESMGGTATRLVIAAIEQKGTFDNVDMLLPVKLIKRESTLPRPQERRLRNATAKKS